jgi:hypothetical protein
MKKLMTIFGAILFASFILTSCGSSTKEKSKDENSSVSTSEKSGDNSASNQKGSTTEKTSSSSTTGDCDQFLKDYESFMVKYIDFLKKYKANPTDPAILSEYTSMAAESQTWSTKTANCAADPMYAAKFSAIAMKIANAAAGL